MYAVAVQGHYAYVGAGSRLVVVNVADKAHPVLAGQTDHMPDVVSGVAVSGTIAYVADGYGGLRILDVSNPAQPQAMGSYTAWDAHAQGVAISGTIVYLATWKGLHVLDVSNPASPQHRGFVSTPQMALNVAVQGQYAYVADEQGGLRVMDISDPSNPHEVGSMFMYAFDLSVAGHYAYVADYFAGLRIIDISDPAHPIVTSLLGTSVPGLGIAVADHYAYLTTSHGLSIIDISEPLTPTQTASMTLDSPRITDVAWADSYAYVADQDDHLYLMNVTNSNAPVQTSTFSNLPGDAWGVMVSGDWAYVADGYNGLRVIPGVDDPHPTQYGFDTPGRAMKTAWTVGYLYVADGDGGVRILGESNPGELSQVGYYDTPGYTWSVAVAEPYAYVADGPAGLRVLNVFDRAHPAEISALDMPDSTTDVKVAGGYAYVAASTGGLHIVSINKPDDPRDVGHYDTPGSATAITLVWPYAYVTDGGSGLRIINVADPAHPFEVGACDTPGWAKGVAVSGNYAYVAVGSSLRVIDVTDPTRPAEVGYYSPTSGDANGVDVESFSGHVYLADGSGGLLILRYHAAPPAASFVAEPTSGRRPLTVVFTDTSTGEPETWLWDLGDGSTSSLPNPSHTYTTAGIYTVSLTVSNTNGSDTLIRPSAITVTGMADFSAAPRWGRPPLTVTFTNQSSGNYTSSEWDFGDGVTSTLTNPTHIYTVDGTFTVTLTVTGPGGEDTEVKSAFIHVGLQTVYLPLVMRDYVPKPDVHIRYVAVSGTDNGNDCGRDTLPCATVQHAVDVSALSDEVRIAAGTYTDVSVRPRRDIRAGDDVTQVVYVSKTVNLRGGYTMENWLAPDSMANPTILDAQGQGRVLYIVGNISPTVEGLRLTGGNAAGLWDDCAGVSCSEAGGGVYAITATVTLSRCQIYGNTSLQGGGLYLSNSPSVLIGNTFAGNTAGFGAGASMGSSDATLTGNTFLNNAASWSGGGVSLSASPSLLSGNAILSNTAGYGDGGGVYISASDARLLDNTIQGNTSNATDYKFAHGGGGVYLSSGGALLSHNVIQGNTARLGGGGLYLAADVSTLNHNLISANTGDGVYLSGSAALLNGNTLIGNIGEGVHLARSDATLINNIIADSDGGGISIYGGKPRLIYNTLARNGGDAGIGVYVSSYVDYSQQYFSSVALTNTILVSHSVGISVTSGNAAAVNGVLWFDTPITISQVAAVTVAVQNQHEGDPAFVNPGGGDYHLRSISAAVDQGVAVEYPLDIDGDYRPLAASPDLGADEVMASPPVCAARLNGTTVYTWLQAAVNASASTSDVIQVAGVCEDTIAWNGNLYVAVLTKTLTVRGGYSPSFVWDPVAYPTVLNGHRRGGVLAIGAGASPTVEYLMLLGGETMEGGGVWSAGSAPVLQNLRLAYNFAWRGGGLFLGGTGGHLEANQVQANRAMLGGGLHVKGADAAVVSGNTLQGNVANKGGGLSLESSASTLSGNAILNNLACQEGGGTFLDESAATLSDNDLLGNTASNGGGVYLTYSPATLNGNTLSNNVAHTNGGGVALDHSPATLSGNTILSNTANHGGGVSLYYFSSGTLDHNVIRDNMAGDGGGVYIWESNAALNGNLVLSNIAAGVGGGLNLNFGDATLTNDVLADNQAGSGGGAYVYMGMTNARFIHATFARNGGGDGSGLYVTGYQFFQPGPSSIALTNTILVSHTVGISVTGDYAVAVNGILWFSTPITVSAKVTSSVTLQNQYEGDPAFALDGYHLMAGSAAIDRGVNAGITSDIDGNTRPFGSGPDLGAVEYVSPTTQLQDTIGREIAEGWRE